MKADLHIHSCLSPCGDMEMTPSDLVGMAKVCGLDLIALTDHNSAKNCPAAAEAAKHYGIGFIPGIEVNTSEDIHCVCLFPEVEDAMSFDRYLYERIPFIKNKENVFGEQLIVHPDGSTEKEEKLLLTACDISIVELPAIVEEFGGICWPAHVDRDSNSLFSMLGTWPQDLDVKAVEIRKILPPGVPANLKVIKASDSHDMAHMMQQGGYEMDLETADFEGLYMYIMDKVRHRRRR